MRWKPWAWLVGVGLLGAMYELLKPRFENQWLLAAIIVATAFALSRLVGWLWGTPRTIADPVFGQLRLVGIDFWKGLIHLPGETREIDVLLTAGLKGPTSAQHTRFREFKTNFANLDAQARELLDVSAADKAEWHAAILEFHGRTSDCDLELTYEHATGNELRCVMIRGPVIRASLSVLKA